MQDLLADELPTVGANALARCSTNIGPTWDVPPAASGASARSRLGHWRHARTNGSLCCLTLRDGTEGRPRLARQEYLLWTPEGEQAQSLHDATNHLVAGWQPSRAS